VAETCKDRVRAALALDTPPYVPYAFGFAAEVRERLSQHYGLDNPFVELGMHVFAVEARPPLDFSPPPLPPDQTIDEFGVRWRTSPHGARYPAGHPLTAPTLESYRWPDPGAPGRMEHIGELIAAHSDRFIVAAVDSTLFERAYFLRGFEEFLMDVALRPGFAHELLDRILAWDLDILDRMLEFPVDGVWFGDDYGHQGGLIMSPRMWRAFIKPRLACLFQRAQRAGLPVFLHSDGAVAGLISDLLDIGLTAINPCQPEALDLAQMRREYGAHLCFCGGISTQRVLSRGTPADVEVELREKVRLLGCGGGYIVATAGSVQVDVPLPNLVRLLDLLRDQDERPLNAGPH